MSVSGLAMKGARLPVTETLGVQRPHAGVAVLELNRPKQLNAINDAMVGELNHTLAALGTDDSVNAVVLTGAGRGFCSGIDMRDFGPGLPEATDPTIDRLRFQETMAALPQARVDPGGARDGHTAQRRITRPCSRDH